MDSCGIDDGSEAGTEPIENIFFTPAAAPQGAVRVQKNASLMRGMSIAVGREQHGTGGSLQ